MAGRESQSVASSIESIIAALDDAWARGDAEAFASRFTADGGFTNVLGMVHYGREAFRERHEAIFKTIYKGSSSRMKVSKLRLIRPDVAIVDVDAELRDYASLPPGLSAAADGVMRTRLEMVFVKENGGWWITSYHNVAVTPLTPR